MSVFISRAKTPLSLFIFPLSGDIPSFDIGDVSMPAGFVKLLLLGKAIESNNNTVKNTINSCSSSYIHGYEYNWLASYIAIITATYRILHAWEDQRVIVYKNCSYAGN